MDNGFLESLGRQEKAEWRVAQEFADIVGEPLCQMNTNALSSMLAYKSNSFSTIYRRRLAVEKYFSHIGNSESQKILGDIDIFALDISDNVKNTYAKDISEFLRRVRPVGIGSMLPTIICLYWMGFSRHEIVAIMVDDIKITDSEITISCGDKTISSKEPPIIKEISSYIDTWEAEFICKDGSTVLLPLDTDGHLLKKFQYHSEQTGGFKPISLTMVSRKTAEKNISQDDIYTSRLFYDIYYNICQQDSNNITNVKQEMFSTYYSYRLFFVWLKVFYGE